MLRRPLGKTELKCSVLGFGCGGTFAKLAREYEAIRLVHAALECGVNIFDTADIYESGESERALGKALGSKRHEVIIATKAGHKLPTYWSRFRGLVGKKKRPKANYSPRYIEKCIVASLKRLGTDYIDIFQLHSPPVELATPEMSQFLDSLKTKGYCRYVGMSAYQPGDANAFLGFVDCVQIAYNERKAPAANPVLDACLESGVGVIARQPLDHGRMFNGAARPELIREAIQSAASRPGVSTVLSGMGSIKHLNSNVEAVRGLA